VIRFLGGRLEGPKKGRRTKRALPRRRRGTRGGGKHRDRRRSAGTGGDAPGCDSDAALSPPSSVA